MADQVITAQKLIDADKDATSLDAFINGADSATVTTRKLRTYPSLAKAVKQVVETGGFEPFITEVALLASVPALPKKAAKALDTKKVWLWDGTKWNDTGLSELDLARDEISQVENNLKIKMYQSNSENLFEFPDAEGNLIARIDKDGMLYVMGFDKPLQLEIKQTFESNSSSDIYQFPDAEGNIVFKIDKDSKCYFAGLDVDIVSHLNNLEKIITDRSEQLKDTSVALTRDYKDTFYEPMQNVLNMLQSAQSGAKAPPPLHLCNHNFTISKDWINQIEMYGDADSQIVRVKTPYHEDGGVVHPNVVEFYNGFRGYRYIACITPYHLTNEAEENPVIYGSHDLTNFEMLDGFEQPLDHRPQPAYSTGHNSDNVLTYDPRTGELICIWRQTIRDIDGNGTRTESLWMRKTKDGYFWTEKERIFLNSKTASSASAGSPAIIFDIKNDCWYMYLTSLSASNPKLNLFKAKNLNEDAWEFVSEVTTPFNPWHQEVKIIGDKVCLLVYCDRSNGHTIHFGIADNFTDFQWTTNLYKDTEAGTYKSSFIPTFNSANQIALKIIYTTFSTHPDESKKWRLYVHQTNFINANMELI